MLDSTPESEEPVRRNADVLGEILWLLAHSRLHRGWRLVDLELFLFPALKTDRYKLYKRDDRPIAYVSIAMLSKTVEERWLAGGYLLQPEDWVSGDRPWIMDFVVPFGDTAAIHEKVFYEPELAGKLVRSLRPNKGSQGLRVISYGLYQVRHQAEWLSQLVNQPSGPATPRPAARASETNHSPTERAGALPHARDLIWLNADDWFKRCCLQHKADD